MQTQLLLALTQRFFRLPALHPFAQRADSESQVSGQFFQQFRTGQADQFAPPVIQFCRRGGKSGGLGQDADALGFGQVGSASGSGGLGHLAGQALLMAA